MQLISKKVGRLMFGTGALGVPASLCTYFAWPLLLMSVMLGFDVEPSGEWDAATIVLNIGNLIAYGGATACLFISPMLSLLGVVLYVLADTHERPAPR